MEKVAAEWKELFYLGLDESVLSDLGEMEAIARRVWLRVSTLLETDNGHWDKRGIEIVSETFAHLMYLGSQEPIYAFLEQMRETHINREVLGRHEGKLLAKKPVTDYFFAPNRILEAGLFFGKLPKYKSNKLPLYSLHAALASALTTKARLAYKDDERMRVWAGFLYEAVEAISKAEIAWLRRGGGISPKGGTESKDAEDKLKKIIQKRLDVASDGLSVAAISDLAIDIVVNHPSLVADAIRITTGSYEESVERRIKAAIKVQG